MKTKEIIKNNKQQNHLSADDPCPDCGKVKNEDGWCDCWQGQNRILEH